MAAGRGRGLRPFAAGPPGFPEDFTGIGTGTTGLRGADTGIVPVQRCGRSLISGRWRSRSAGEERGRRVREGRSTARRAGSLSPFTAEGEQDDCQDNSAEPTLRAEKQKNNKQYRNEATSHILLGSIKTAIPYSPAHRDHAAAGLSRAAMPPK